MPIETVVAEATFVGNAMLSVGDGTPYNAVYGRVPRMLPSIDQVSPTGQPQSSNKTLEDSHRLREISIEAMIHASAVARLGRALNTRTTMPAQRLALDVGEPVDFYREPTNKDTSGWMGPAEVLDVSKVERGVVVVRWNSQQLNVSLNNVRRHMFHFVFLECQAFLSRQNAWAHIKQCVEQAGVNSLIQVGLAYQDGHWCLTKANSEFHSLMSAVRHFAENQLHLSGVVSARIGQGVKTLHAIKGYSSAVVVLWSCKYDCLLIDQVSTSPNMVDALAIHKIYTNWSYLRVLQILCNAEHHVEE